MEKPTLSLQPSEQALVAAASRIYSAYIVAGMVAEGQEQGWMTRAIREALWIAQASDEATRVDEEVSG